MKRFDSVIIAATVIFLVLSGSILSAYTVENTTTSPVSRTQKTRVLQPTTGSPSSTRTTPKASVKPVLKPVIQEPAGKKLPARISPSSPQTIKILTGHCCSQGEIGETTKGQCNNSKGFFSLNKPEAQTVCDSYRGFCCVDGKNIRLTRSQCKQKEGAYATSRSDANRLCKSVTQQISPDRQRSSSDKQKQSRTVITGTTLRPVLSDLQVTRTWLNRQCIMQVNIKNNGGPIAKKQFNQARIHVSAGPNNSLPQAKSYLRFADKKRNLMKAGGAVTFNTGLVVSGNAQSLVWVDTDHHIQESNEQNNGDDQSLNCGNSISTGSLKPGTKDRQGAQGGLAALKLNQKNTVKPPVPPPPPPNPGPNGDQPGQAIMMESALQNIAVEPNLPDIIDLAVMDITLSISSHQITSPRLAQNFNVTVTIKNIGFRNQSENSSVAYFQMELTDFPYTNYYRNLIAPFTMALPPLMAGEEHTIKKGVTIPRVLQNNPIRPGMYKFDAVINTSGYQPGEEINQENNHFTKKFEVRDPQPTDLFIKSLNLTQDCRLRVTLENRAAPVDKDDLALAFLRVNKVQAGTGNKYDQVPLKTADPNERLTQSFNFWPSPTYTWPVVSSVSPNWSIGLEPGESAAYTVIVDPYHAIFDNHRENNSKTRTLTCP